MGVNAAAKWFRERLLRRRYSYRRLFLGDDGELTPDGRRVLGDLKKFCRGDTSTTIMSPVSRTVDPLASMQAEGRREVYTRILQMLHLPERVITELSDDDD